MPFSLTCPQCRGKIRVADKLAGKKIKCPKCAAIVPVPAPEEEAITAELVESGGISDTLSSPEEIAEKQPIRPRRAERDVRLDPAEEAIATIIPYKNGRALAAYYLGVFSLIPCLGLILGPAALVLGILGLRYVKANPTAKGTGHAIVGIVVGSLTTLGNWGIAIAVMVMGSIAAVK